MYTRDEYRVVEIVFQLNLLTSLYAKLKIVQQARLRVKGYDININKRT